MEFRILGPLEVLDGGRPLPIREPATRALLGLLLLHNGGAVPAPRVNEEVWPESPPGEHDDDLAACVAELRSLLGRDAVDVRDSGYAIRLEGSSLDLAQFEALHAAARASDRAESAGILRAALALWRGHALADVGDERFARAERARLEEERLSALEERIDADLAVGRRAELVGELTALVAAHPSRGRFRTQLVAALDRGVEEAPGAVSTERVQPERHDPPSQSVTREVRKVITVVFADITSSTELGEQLDPEALRRVMGRYFDTMRGVLERHGATVEKFVGDAVMAMFGMPLAHEDDALRAVRAALEMREQLDVLNAELERAWGFGLAVRTGVNTGEVLAGDLGPGNSFLVADAVNMAARLEQAAEPGEILIGQATYRLVQGAVVAERVGPLTLKGKTEPVPAWRLAELAAAGPGWSRRLDSPIVGRAHELAVLEDAFDRVERERSAQLVTLLGPGGAGKSRLAGEFLSRLRDRARVVTGGCPPYGDGITFFPVVALLRTAAAIEDVDSPADARRKLAALLPAGGDAPLVEERLAALLGDSGAVPAIQETFWAVRKLLETLGEETPIVVVFEDIHWAEPTLLDLIEYLVDWIRSAPVLVVCITRPDILDTRPAWTSARANATVLTLAPLTAEEIDVLIGNLVEGAELASAARARIAELAEGNPLYVEETLRMLVDDGLLQPREGGWVVRRDLATGSIPPTIHALLAARLDRLYPEERAVGERASVVGRVFSWGSLLALLPPELAPELMRQLQSLMRKELIRPEYAATGGDDAFRFAHVLMRDAAYQGIPKGVRADLHEQLANWIEATTPEGRVDADEVLGHHLEQAQRFLVELSPLPDGRADALARRAGDALARAGRRAYARGDMPAAGQLLTRACGLLPRSDRRSELLPLLAFALLEIGDLAGLEPVLEGMRETVGASGDTSLEAHAAIVELWIRLFTKPEGWTQVAAREAAHLLSVFEARNDERGLSRSWSLLALVHTMNAQFGPSEEAWTKAAAFARGAGDRRDELESLSWVPLMVVAGPTHVEEARKRCENIRDRAQGDKKATSSALIGLAVLEAAVGRFEEARILISEAKALLHEVALAVWQAGPLAQFAGWIELMAADPPAAERELRAGYDTLVEIGEASWLSTVAALLAEAVHRQGRNAESEELAAQSERVAPEEDAYSQTLIRIVRAKIGARRGDHAAAEKLAREAVALADGTDFLLLRSYAHTGLAEVLRSVGDSGEARRAFLVARAVAEEKGIVVLARSAVEPSGDQTSTAPATG